MRKTTFQWSKVVSEAMFPINHFKTYIFGILMQFVKIWHQQKGGCFFSITDPCRTHVVFVYHRIADHWGGVEKSILPAPWSPCNTGRWSDPRVTAAPVGCCNIKTTKVQIRCRNNPLATVLQYFARSHHNPLERTVASRLLWHNPLAMAFPRRTVLEKRRCQWVVVTHKS